MRSLIMACLFSLLLTGVCHGVTVPPDITKTVVFIYTDADGAPNHADGTGFLVSVPIPSHQDRLWLYLVTAQHVLHIDGNHLGSPFHPRLFVRLNKKDGTSVLELVDIRIFGPTQTVYLSSDPTVDIAVIPISIPDPSQLDIKVLPEEMLATRDDLQKYNIGVGCDMFFTGMFAPYQGQKRSYPIVRFGKLAMIPEERIPFGESFIDAYLVETFSFGGNSGSPVFFYPSSDNTPGRLMVGSPMIKIAGVMKGFFGDVEPVMMAQPAAIAGQAVPVSESNSGIAVVVPAEHISQILHSEALEQKRRSEP